MYLGVLRTTARRVYKYMENMTKESPIKFEKENTIGNISAVLSENAEFEPSNGLKSLTKKSEGLSALTNIKTTLSIEAIDKLSNPLKSINDFEKTKTNSGLKGLITMKIKEITTMGTATTTTYLPELISR